jgi:hypothetical protein
MLDSPIKFPSSLSSSEDELPAHQSSKEGVSSDDWMPSDYSPLWSSKEDLEEEDEDEDKDDDADVDDDNDSDSTDSDSDSNFDSPPPKRVRQAYLD